MVIDPWGEIMAELPEGEGIIAADISLKKLTSIRDSMPVLGHKRV